MFCSFYDANRLLILCNSKLLSFNIIIYYYTHGNISFPSFVYACTCYYIILCRIAYDLILAIAKRRNIKIIINLFHCQYNG